MKESCRGRLRVQERASLLFVLIAATGLASAEQPVNTWAKLDKAVLDGQRWDVPLGYSRS